MIELLLILVGLALVMACGAFVAAEFAFITVDRPSVERAAERGDARAAGVVSALRSLSTQLSGAQLGITVTNLAIGFLAQPAVARLIDAPLEGVGVPETAVTGLALALSLALATGVTMVFGELVPKNLAIARPLATARAVQGFHRGFTRATGPAIRFLNGTANGILRRLGVEPQEELASARSPQELSSLVSRSADKGTLPAETAALVQRSLVFGARRAEDVMTPRVQMVTVPADAKVQEVIDLTCRSGFSRFPVMGADSDDVIGMAHVKRAVTVDPERRSAVLVTAVMDPPVLVPETLPLDELLETLRAGGLQAAAVVDEYGGIAGLVTFEDLVEELVGDVRDEHDASTATARREQDGTWNLSGLLRPDEVQAITGVALPEDEAYETLGGLLVAELGRVPESGDEVRVQEVGLRVERMDGLRVDRVRLDPDLEQRLRSRNGAGPAS